MKAYGRQLPAQRRSFAVVARRSGNRAIEPEVMEVRNGCSCPEAVDLRQS